MSSFESNSLVADNLKFYDVIKPRNPSQSYTVIATINDYKTRRLLALATGTQANLSLHPDDIEDCHAESLVKRAYKRYLIDRLTAELSRASDLSHIEGFVGQDYEHDLVLFVSQFPCGLVKRYGGEEPVDPITGITIKRKPGKGTSKEDKIIYVEKDNCYTKLQKWMDSGLQGSKLGQVLKIRSTIKRIIIGGCEPDQNFDYQLQLDRFKQGLLSKIDSQSLQVDLLEDVRRDEFVFDSNRQSQPVSLVWWRGSEDTHKFVTSQGSKRLRMSRDGTTELIVDGRRRGLTKKQCLSNIERYKLKIGDYWIRKDLASIEESLKGLH